MAKNDNKKPKVKKMDGRSKNIWEEKLEKLRQEFPEVLTENEVDCDQLKRLIGDENVAEGERYQFTWAGKSAAFQEIKKRTTATLKPDKSESVNFDETENLFIEGENLQALRILQKSYYGRVKMIYIDPPYNTGNNFIYNDQFAENREEYEEKTGDIDEEGKKLRAFRKNTKESGHYHSNWLSMMYPRLYLARNLLREDGVFFVSIGEQEVHNLRYILNEIFGGENYLTTIARVAKTASDKGNFFAPSIDFILCYAKDITSLNKFSDEVDVSLYPKKDKRGRYRDDVALYQSGLIGDRPNCRYYIETPDGSKVIPPKGKFWRWSKEKTSKNKDLLVFKKTETSPLLDEKDRQAKYNIYTKSYLKDRQKKGVRPRNYLEEFINRKGADYLKTLSIPFDYSKPVELIEWLIKIIRPGNNDIILDFFAGSGTTADALMRLNAEDGGNKKYIMVQLPEETEEGSEARKAGYETIADIAKERIRRAAKKVTDDKAGELDFRDKEFDLGFKVLKLSPSNFKSWRREEVENVEKLEQKLEDMIENVKEGAQKENMLFELMLKLGIDPNTKVEDKKGYYSIEGGEYIICLADKIDKGLVGDILNENPRIVVCLDTAFKGNDELKTNTALQMKSKDIEFKVV